MKRLLREPLLHFVLLGAVLFGVYAYAERGRGGVEPSRQIHLSVDDIAQLAVLFQSQWRRDPTPDEFGRMVENRSCKRKSCIARASRWASTRTTLL